MSGQHRQIPTYSKDDELAEMREGGVDAALIHPPSTLPRPFLVRCGLFGEDNISSSSKESGEPHASLRECDRCAT
jgi:hypothetical protein